MENQINKTEIGELLRDVPAHHAALISALFSANDTRILSLEDQLQQAQQRVAWLEEQFKLNQARLYGRSSESAAALQQAFLFDEAQSTPPESETGDAEQEEQVDAYTRKKKSCGRKLDISKLPLERRYYDLPEDQKICACGHALHKIDESVTTQIEHIKAQLKAIEPVQVKYGCR